MLTVRPQGYPAQQYLQGGQYPAAGTQYAPSAPQPSAPSPSYPGHRMQPGMGQYLSASGSAGPYYKVRKGTVRTGTRAWGGRDAGRGCHPRGTSLSPQPAEQFNGQGASFGTYSQAAINGVSPRGMGVPGRCLVPAVTPVTDGGGAPAAGPVDAGVPQLAPAREPHAAHDAGEQHGALHVPGPGRQVALPARHEARHRRPAPLALG